MARNFVEDYDALYENDEDPLDPFIGSAFITEVLHTVKSGKEGTVYCCRAHPSTGLNLIAAKHYRDRMHRGFKNDATYRQNWMVHDTHEKRAVRAKSDFGRDVAFGMWVEHEYQTLRALHALGADVPRPLTRSDNVILMEFIGDEEQAGQPLHTVRLRDDEVRPLFNVVVRNIELWLANNLIHADLSAYNILYWNGRVTIIDVPQAIDPRFNSEAQAFLQRDIHNVCSYFGRYGVRADPERMAGYLWARFVRSEL